MSLSHCSSIVLFYRSMGLKSTFFGFTELMNILMCFPVDYFDGLLLFVLVCFSLSQKGHLLCTSSIEGY